jgi:hypothetical protein
MMIVPGADEIQQQSGRYTLTPGTEIIRSSIARLKEKISTTDE